MPAFHANALHVLRSCFEAGDGPRHSRLLARQIRAGRTDLFTLIQQDVFGDEWFDFAAHSLKIHFQRTKGHVYVVTPLSFETKDDLVLSKVGKTRSEPASRLKQLNNEAVVEPWVLRHSLYVHDRHWVEKQVHHALRDYRWFSNREFFSAHLSQLLKTLEKAAAEDLAIFERQGLYGVWSPTE